MSIAAAADEKRMRWAMDCDGARGTSKANKYIWMTRAFDAVHLRFVALDYVATQ